MAELSSFAKFLPTLVAARTARGWSRATLADKLGLRRSTIDSWERGYRTPARANAQRWADVLEVQLPADTTGWFSKATRHMVAVCGTRGGAQRHRRHQEPVCAPCLAAEAGYARAWRAGRAAGQVSKAA